MRTTHDAMGRRFVSQPFLPLLLTVATVGLLSPSAVHAVDGVWSGQTGGLWSNPGNWNGGIVADGTGAFADFGPPTVGVGTTVSFDAPRTLGGLRFAGAGAAVYNWTLNNNGNQGNVLTLAGPAPSITIRNGICTNNLMITGVGGLAVNGSAGTASKLVLAAPNIFTGDLMLNASPGGSVSLFIDNATALGGSPAAPNSVILSGNAAARSHLFLNVPKMTYPVYNSLVMRPMGTDAGARAEFRSEAGNMVWSGAITLDGLGGSALSRSDFYSDTPEGVMTLNGNITSINDYRGLLGLRGNYNGVINGSINAPNAVLAKDDPGTWIINSANNIWAGTLINFGVLKLGTDNCLPPGAGLTFVLGAGPATFDLNGFRQRVAALATSGGNEKRITSSTGPGVLTVDNAAAVTFSGVVQGNLSLRKMNTGKLTLSGACTYTGDTVIDGGTLAVASVNGLSGSKNIMINSGAVLAAAGFRLASGQKLSPVDGMSTIAGTLGLGSGILVLNYTKGTPALNISGGNLVLSDTSLVVINVTGSLVAGETYQLTTSFGGGQVSGTMPATVVLNGAGGVSGTLSVANGLLYLALDIKPSVASQTPFPYTNQFTLFAGSSPVFSVTPSGRPPFGYIWYTNGVRVPSATRPSLRWPDVKVGSISAYCVVTNAYGSVTSKVWSAAVIPVPPGMDHMQW